MSAILYASVRCDDCGTATAPLEGGSQSAKLAAIENGWRHHALGIDYCPDCEHKHPPKQYNTTLI